MYVLSSEVFLRLSFKNFPMWGFYYIHFLHLLILEVLTINRGLMLFNKTSLYSKTWFAGPGSILFNTENFNTENY